MIKLVRFLRDFPILGKSLSWTDLEQTKRNDFACWGPSCGPLAGRVFRIGHLGDMNEPMILGALAGVEAAMTVQKIPYGPNGMAAAIAYLAQHTP